MTFDAFETVTIQTSRTSVFALGTWYIEAGGPLGLWRRWADDVRGDAVAAAPQPR